jgi:purine-binding chemotaxis protein CheW
MKTVIFDLAGKEYGIDIKQVREVIRLRKIVPVPDAAAFVEGVISLRGKVVTLVNLRKKLNLPAKEIDRSVRIITEIGANTIGMIADGVSGVIDIGQENITSPDEALKGAKYLTGIAKVNNRIILLADIQQLLSGEDKTGIDDVFARVEVHKKSQGQA